MEQCHGSNRAAYVRAKNKSFELHTKQQKSWKTEGVHLSSRSIVSLSMKVNRWLVKTKLLANRVVLTTKGQSSSKKAVSEIITVNHVAHPSIPPLLRLFHKETSRGGPTLSHKKIPRLGGDRTNSNPRCR